MEIDEFHRRPTESAVQPLFEHPAKDDQESVLEPSLEQLRVRYAHEFGFPDDTTLEEMVGIMEKLGIGGKAIQRIQREEERLRLSEEDIATMAQGLGLSTTASWDEVYEARRELERENAVRDYGLPVNASWEEIYATIDKRDQVIWAKQLGVEEDATYEELEAIQDRQNRAAIAKALGWEEDAIETAVGLKNGVDPYPSWEDIIHKLLDFSEPVDTEQVLERIKQVYGENPQW